jgi:hypothetical protein
MVMSDVMSGLAATDEYDPFAAEKFVPPVLKDWTAQAASKDVATLKGMGSVLSDALTLPERAIQNSQFAVDTGTYDPRVPVEAALLPMGTGAVAGVKALPGEMVAGAGPIRAYHSSPHDFDKFDLSKIGTGEGAQVYGHGLYFAENPAVSGQGGQYWQQFKSRFGDTPEAYAANVLESAKFDRGRATADLDRLLKTYGDNAPVTAREARALLASDKPVGPRTYEVNINADPAHFLDWDKPLSGQSEAVREALSPQRLGLKAAGPLGEKGYYGWTDAQNRLIGRAQTKDLPAEIFDPREMAPSVYRGGGTWKPPEASERLREAGIPGIKYLDEGSRGVWDVRENSKGFRGQQSISPGYGGAMSEYFPTRNAAQDWINKTRTSNYVVFDPNRVDIMKKYAVPGAIGAGGMGALTAQDQYQPGGM